MNLQDFATLAEAQAYQQVNYTVIPTSRALQFLLGRGVEDNLHANQTNATTVDVGGTNITIGSICRGVLGNTTGFDVDPVKSMGQFNLGVISILVGTGLITQSIADDFIALGQATTTPFASKTEHEFQVAKGTVNRVICGKTAKGDYAIMTVETETPTHTPRMTLQDGTTIESFYNVSVVGKYVAKIPNQHRGADVYVDNAYNAVV